MQLVETAGETDFRKNAQERVMALAWRTALAGIRRGDAEALQTREDQINTFVTRHSEKLAKVIK
jgi:hypothetical protein